MSKEKRKKSIKKPEDVKQLLNFAEKECELFDISEIRKSVLAIYGGDENRLINLRLAIEKEGKTDILKFFNDKKNQSAISKRLKMAIMCILTCKRDTKFYEIELKGQYCGVIYNVGVLKFHSQENTRVISREYGIQKTVEIIMIEAYKKKVEKNEGKYANRLQSASKRKHYEMILGQKKYYL